MARIEEQIGACVPALLRQARAMTHSLEDAEDLVQEAVLKTLEDLRVNDRADIQLRAWLRRIVRNLAYNRSRDRKRRMRRLKVDGWLLKPRSVTPQDVQEAGVVEDAVDGLPPKFREVIVARCLDGLDIYESADAMGVPVGTVLSRLSRAREALADELERGMRVR